MWLAAVLVVAAVPGLLSDPALWTWLADPELVVLFVVVAVRYAPGQVQLVRAMCVHRFRRWYAVSASRGWTFA